MTLSSRPIAGTTALAAALLAAGCGPSTEQLAAEHGAVIERYCTECHDAAEQEAGLVLENADLLHPAANAAV